MDNNILIPELNSKTIESMIYVIRGVKVMLDFELANIYGYETKNFNRQVKNNIDKFPNDFRFQLSRDEIDSLSRCKNFTLNKGRGSNIKYLPYAFTEQGIYMIMTVLKGELATKQSISIIRTFKQMKDYIIESNNLISTNELLKLTNKVSEIENKQINSDKFIKDISKDNKSIKKKLEIVMDNFIDSSKYKHYLILDGERIEAIIAYQTIYSLAKKSIYIIDDFIDVKTLQLLKVCKENIEIIIFSDNKAKNNITTDFISDFTKDTGMNIIFKENNNRFHDRYIVIDYDTNNESIYHCGASSKDSGKRINTIMKIEDIKAYNLLFKELLEK